MLDLLLKKIILAVPIEKVNARPPTEKYYAQPMAQRSSKIRQGIDIVQ